MENNDIEKQFDEYVVNKIKTAMKNGERWEILDSNSHEDWAFKQFPNAQGFEGKKKVNYTRQCKLGKCFIITAWSRYSDGTPFNDQPIPQVIAGNYCGEGLNQECLREIEKLIQQYDKEEQTLERPERLKRIMDNNA